MDRIIEKEPWYFQKKNWFLAGGIIGIIILYSAFLGENGSRLRVDKEKISTGEVHSDFFRNTFPERGQLIQ